jgi:hypothetical protein
VSISSEVTDWISRQTKKREEAEKGGKREKGEESEEG